MLASSSARIHARALGDLSKRIMYLDGDLALEMYHASEATRLKLFQAAPKDHWARQELEASFSGPTTTMEQLKRNAYDKAPVRPENIIDFERKSLSKWNHGDILALIEAGQRLLAADERVRTALGYDKYIEFTLHRAVGFVLGILLSLHARIPSLDILPTMNALNERNAVYAERFNNMFSL